MYVHVGTCVGILYIIHYNVCVHLLYLIVHNLHIKVLYLHVMFLISCFSSKTVNTVQHTLEFTCNFQESNIYFLNFPGLQSGIITSSHAYLYYVGKQSFIFLHCNMKWSWFKVYLSPKNIFWYIHVCERDIYILETCPLHQFIQRKRFIE